MARDRELLLHGINTSEWVLFWVVRRYLQLIEVIAQGTLVENTLHLTLGRIWAESFLRGRGRETSVGVHANHHRRLVGVPLQRIKGTIVRSVQRPHQAVRRDAGSVGRRIDVARAARPGSSSER